MSRRNPFKRHRFPREIILLAVRWSCRWPLSCRDVRGMRAERGAAVDASAVHRRVRKFGPGIRKRAQARHRARRGLQWRVDETCVRAGGRWRCLWRAVDPFGQLIDFRLTARRDA
ncbi:DDE-type integrase/transposase/recombinase, partial [Cribrihabitans pelagius]|uniref:DDE-type integrase/transposase/recombinase n=1 Tax=Cribrihabitans pelagius TaxID=1765746 RepID=UPI003B5B4040